MRRDRDDRGALRLDARDLAIAKRLGIGGALEGDAEHERAGGPVAAREELRQIHIARAKAALHRNRRIERQQRDREIAEGRGGEKIAADGSHVAHRRPADRARGRMKIGKLALAQNLGKRDASAPIVARAPLARICARPRSSRRTRVVISTSPSLRARMTSVPPPMKRAPRSDDSAAAASAGVAKVFTADGHRRTRPRHAASRKCLRIASNPAW